MGQKLDSVNTSRKARYHHGALRPALIAAATALIAERGTEGFSLREAARRAGVSPSAPAHHFRDTRGLLTAVATQAHRELADALETGRRGGRVTRLYAMARAYVGFALAAPERFDLMWRQALLNRDDPDFSEAAGRVSAILDQAVWSDAAPRAGEEPPLAPSIAYWSLIHGFARLALDGAFGSDEGAAERAAEALLGEVVGQLAI